MAVVVATLEVLRDQLQLPCSEVALSTGIAATDWKGRLQVLRRDPPLLLDGAHNPGAATVLVQTLKRMFKGQPFGLVLGMCADKHVRATLHALAPLSPRIWTVSLANDRGMSSGDLCQLVRAAGLQVTASEDLLSAMDQASAWGQAHNGVVCVTGSLFLAGDLLRTWKRGGDDNPTD